MIEKDPPCWANESIPLNYYHDIFAPDPWAHLDSLAPSSLDFTVPVSGVLKQFQVVLNFGSMKKPLSQTSNYSMTIFWQPLLSFLYITSPSPSHLLSEEVYTVYQYHYINAARAMWLLPGVGELSTSTSSLNPWTLGFLQGPISVTPAIRPPAAITWLKCKGDEHDHHDEDEDQKEKGGGQVVSEWTSSSNIQQPAGLTCLPTKTTTDHPPVVVPIPRAGGRRSHSKTRYFQLTPRRRRAKTCEITAG